MSNARRVVNQVVKQNDAGWLGRRMRSKCVQFVEYEFLQPDI